VGALLAHFVGRMLGELVGIAGGLVQLYGAWLLTEPDPSGIGEDRYGTARRIIRVSLVVGLGNQLLNLVAEQARMSQELTIAVGAVALLAGIFGLVGQFALFRYLERLALRIPAPELSARARFLFWAYGGSLAAIVVMGGVFALVIATTGPSRADLAGISMVFGCIMLIALISLLVFGIMFLILLGRLMLAFQANAKYARQVWSPHGAA
jgi:hypothetical protein